MQNPNPATNPLDPYSPEALKGALATAYLVIKTASGSEPPKEHPLFQTFETAMDNLRKFKEGGK